MRTNSLQRQPWVPLLGVALIASIAFAFLSGQFLTSFNIYVILSSAALLAVIGFSQMVALGVGEFSLAIGGIGSFAGVIIGLLLKHDAPLALALAGGLAVAAACGFVNGLLVARSGVSGFVITLATGGLFSGAALAITRSRAYGNLPELLTTFGTGRLGFLPYVAIATIVVAIWLAVLYRWRRMGRMMLAIGGNAEAAQLSGLSRSKAIASAHTLSGILAGVAGVMAMAQLHEASPLAGIEWLIESFAIAVIGGTSLTGGSISVLGVVVAAVILATINDGLILINVDPYWVTLVEGLLIFLAVMLGRPEALRGYRLLARKPAGAAR